LDHGALQQGFVGGSKYASGYVGFRLSETCKHPTHVFIEALAFARKNQRLYGPLYQTYSKAAFKIGQIPADAPWLDSHHTSDFGFQK